MEDIKYSFKVTFNKYERKTCLNDTRTINVSNITIVAKNAKFGCIYRSGYVKFQKGKFNYASGSNNYPILFPMGKKVEIFVTNFPCFPVLKTLRDHIEISDIKQLINT